MKDYMVANRAVYDDTVREFVQKAEERIPGKTRLVDDWIDEITEQGFAPPLDLLELGAATGEAANIMTSRGHTVAAVEFSEAMAKVAAQHAPDATIIVDEFLEHDFGDQKFDGIYAVAFIHLFPLEDARLVAEKMHEILRPRGIAFVSTTKHEADKEGYDTKVGFVSTLRRFRRQYSKQGFESLMRDAGFELTSYNEGTDSTEPGKLWMNAMFRRGEQT